MSSLPKMPVLFAGHGSPMNAIEQNEFTRNFAQTAASLAKPKAILSISAHWMTNGTFVTAMPTPPTIHDFGGFPPALFAAQYPAPGSPELAARVQALVQKTPVQADMDWGLDHGTWSVLTHCYPAADVPVVQLSLDMSQPPKFHYMLAKELAPLRQEGVLIFASGNIVHNLRLLDWQHLETDNYSADWALQASQQIKHWITTRDHTPLFTYRQQGEAIRKAIPTPEHFLPLLYVLALQEDNDTLTMFNDKAVGGSLTMTSVLLTPPSV